ncbi:MAG: HAD family phosphatase [Candidatus Nanopelagicales bacterium]|nr:HAD family phosphatase [Candidatus Nanopelagicales bacterium]
MWPFEGVLFDMDGTLVDTEPVWRVAEAELMHGFGAEWTAEDQDLAMGGSATRVTRYMADKIAASGGQRPDPEILVDMFDRVMLRMFAESPPELKPGTPELLVQVASSGLPIALVSSSPRRLMTAILDGIGDDWFDVTVAAEDVDHHKPDPLPYLRAAELLGVDPARCVVIEDSRPGVESAVAAGAFVIAVQELTVIAPGPRSVVVDSLVGVDLALIASWYRGPS